MRTTPVGIYPYGMTPDGIHDMAGNVYEWTATRYAGYPHTVSENLENPDTTGLRVRRGGGWAANRTMVRCAFRYWVVPWNGFDSLGYRLARTLS